MTYGIGSYIDYRYDIFDRVIRQTYNNSIAYQYQYNANGDLARQYEKDAPDSTVRSYSFEIYIPDRLIRSQETDASDLLTVCVDHN